MIPVERLKLMMQETEELLEWDLIHEFAGLLWLEAGTVQPH